LADFRSRRLVYFLFASGMSVVILAFCALSIGLVLRQRSIAERLRVMKVRAESTNRLKSQFLASVSHELRTPLNGVVGYAELLSETLEDEEKRGYAKVIFDSSQHLLALLNSVLDMARVESGEMRLHPEEADLRTMIEDVCATYLPVARSKRLELRYSAPEGTIVYCDRVRVMQVLNNLVHNALKFTDHGSVSVDARLEGDNWVVEVSDTGCGIDSSFHELIFERFRQADEFNTRKHDGAGLGLALCRELAGLMGGRITVLSAPGEGSVFRFCLPNQGRGDR
jgi:signal transduction histidine kinase